MKYFLKLAVVLLFFTSCKNELTFEERAYHQISALPCEKDCPHVDVKIPFAKNVPIVADSINKKVFLTMKEIIYFGEKPYDSSDYDDLLTSFIGSYEKIQKEAPEEKIGWEAEITGRVIYTSDEVLNIEIQHYSYTGGAHGYSGKRSLLFDPATGKAIENQNLFKDTNTFKAFAEKRFRAAFQLNENESINSNGLMFEDGIFQLPQTYFFTDKGFLLYYNVYEIASYADGPKQLLLPYQDIQPYLVAK